MNSFSMYDLKDTVSPPNRYLGANVGKWQFSDGSNCCWVNGSDYTVNTISLSKKPMEQNGKLFVYVKRAKRPMQMSYRPELYVSQVLNPKESQDYQQFVVIARCIIELGRVDIIYDVSLISSHLDMQQKLHMEGLMIIFIYLDKAYGKTNIVDPVIPKVDTSVETEKNWLKSIYSDDDQEEISSNTTEPLVKLMSVNFFVYSSHAGEKLTYLSHTVIIIYVNNIPIDWFSKRQNTVETSTFGA